MYFSSLRVLHFEQTCLASFTKHRQLLQCFLAIAMRHCTMRPHAPLSKAAGPRPHPVCGKAPFLLGLDGRRRPCIDSHRTARMAKKTGLLQTLVTPDLKRWVHSEAKRSSLSVAAWLRVQLARARAKSRRPTPPRRPPSTAPGAAQQATP